MEQLHEDFWTIRGDLRIAGLLNIGTQMSLIRLRSGRFLLIDSYQPEEEDLDALMEVTGGGSAIDAVLNVHPFHTLHCEAIARLFPDARHFGTRRHHREMPELDWEEGFIEDPATQSLFAADLDFSVPAGLDFIPEDEKVHVASVLVRHRASRIVHVDDTFVVWDPPGPLGSVLPDPQLRFHPMLSKALEQRRGAAEDFAGWARELASDWTDTQIVCAAHSAVHRLEGSSFAGEVLEALDRAQDTLENHRDEFSAAA
jgi:hypothetical protein